MEAAPFICFSHLRWDSVFQRPHHLMTRFARQRPVYFVEEPRDVPEAQASLDVRRDGGVLRVTPQLPIDAGATRDVRVAQMLAQFFAAEGLTQAVHWYYTPAALALAKASAPRPIAVIYDCMDELSAFLGAPASLIAQEQELFAHADLVFTGGRSLYEAKRPRHPGVHCFPSSVDVAHFATARDTRTVEPFDQASLPRPRAGFFGVIDERLDLDLIAGLADARPGWTFVYIGPIVKIDPASVPQRANIHYFGQRPYDVLPAYASGWDAALMPFALNAATRYISPTKTLEYMAAGLPVLATPIADVVDPYGAKGLVTIVRGVEEAARALDAADAERTRPWLRSRRRAAADQYLDEWSWDGTWERMDALMAGASAASSTEAPQEPRRSA